jgi:hypothetical protein
VQNMFNVVHDYEVNLCIFYCELGGKFSSYIWVNMVNSIVKQHEVSL